MTSAKGLYKTSERSNTPVTSRVFSRVGTKTIEALASCALERKLLTINMGKAYRVLETSKIEVYIFEEFVSSDEAV